MDNVDATDKSRVPFKEIQNSGSDTIASNNFSEMDSFVCLSDDSSEEIIENRENQPETQSSDNAERGSLDSFIEAFERNLKLSSPSIHNVKLDWNRMFADDNNTNSVISNVTDTENVEQTVIVDSEPIDNNTFEASFRTAPNDSRTDILEDSVKIDGELGTEVDTFLETESVDEFTEPNEIDIRNAYDSDLNLYEGTILINTEPNVESDGIGFPVSVSDLNLSIVQEEQIHDMSGIMDGSFDKKFNDASVNGAGDCKIPSIDNKQTDSEIQVNQTCLDCDKYKSESQNMHLYKEENEKLKVTCKQLNDEIESLRANDVALNTEIKDLKAQIVQLDTRFKEIESNESKLSVDLSNKKQSEIQVKRVMDEYEKSISSFVAEIEKLKKERDTAQIHLSNAEHAFSDVHQKYERCKEIIRCYKDNEESFKQDITSNEETILKQEQKYESLKAHAMTQVEKYSQEISTMKKQNDQEIARVTAQIKRLEIKNNSLIETLSQKSKECEQLSAICDEFIGQS